jgi:hypothetical protein
MAGRDYEYFKKKLKDVFGENKCELLSNPSIGATQYFTCTKNGINRKVFGIWISGENDTAIYHEATHCAWDMLTQRGVAVTYENHETLTYLADYIADTIKKQIPKRKR